MFNVFRTAPDNEGRLRTLSTLTVTRAAYCAAALGVPPFLVRKWLSTHLALDGSIALHPSRSSYMLTSTPRLNCLLIMALIVG